MMISSSISNYFLTGKKKGNNKCCLKYCGVKNSYISISRLA